MFNTSWSLSFRWLRFLEGARRTLSSSDSEESSNVSTFVKRYCSKPEFRLLRIRSLYLPRCSLTAHFTKFPFNGPAQIPLVICPYSCSEISPFYNLMMTLTEFLKILFLRTWLHVCKWNWEQICCTTCKCTTKESSNWWQKKGTGTWLHWTDFRSKHPLNNAILEWELHLTLLVGLSSS